MKKAIKDATTAIKIGGKPWIIGIAYSTRAKTYRDIGNQMKADRDFKIAVNMDPSYDIYRYFTITEYLADSAGKSGSLESVSRMGGILIVAIFFVLIFKIDFPAPRKRKKSIKKKNTKENTDI